LFRDSPRLSSLLQYTVSQAQAGRSGDLKESVLGVEVFGRKPGYDPQSCSIVRVEFTRLRKKLDQYYQTEGRDDPVRIRFLRGSYVPELCWAAHTASPGAQPVPRTHLAVLPFIPMGSNADDEYFAAGLTEELITALGRVPDLRVVARTSSFALRERTDDVREIGRALKVNVVLEGSVRRQGSRLRIHAQLIDTADRTQVWAERHERELTDVFEVQDEITAAIVAALELELPHVTRRAAASGTRNVRAHELYLKGRYWWHRANPSMCARAADLFREAIACDPFYAAPYSGLADACFNQAAYGHFPPREMIPQAEAAARKALDLDDTSAEAHCSLGLIEGGLNWNTARCEAELRRSIELNPSYALGLAKYGTSYLSLLGRFEEAHDYISRGLELDPLSPNLHADLTLNLGYRGEWDRFEAEARKVLEMDSGVYKLHLFLIAALGFQGNWRAAVDAADAACALFAEDAYLLGYTAWAYAGSGQTAQAKAIQDRLAMRARRQYTPPLSLAVAHLHSDTETVFACLEKALEAHEPLLRFAVRLSPPFYGLHSDPRLQNVARRVGL
jgi:TolB-like protein/tetratricopeptide (TPR) repeat protein